MMYVNRNLHPNLNGWDRKHKIDRTDILYKSHQYIEQIIASLEMNATKKYYDM